MEHRGNADPGSQMLRVGGDGDHRLGGRLEQQVIDHGLVLIGNIGDGRRQREHDMEIADGE